MLRYALDALGWYEFEGLSQALLKTRLGVGVEAWGGSGDWGRDAYCDHSLQYPTNQQTSGPFVFQCKFVDGANAAGANADSALLNAVKKECLLIEERVGSTIKRGAVRAPVWTKEPTVYALITNAPVSGKLRKTIGGLIEKVLKSTIVVIHDGSDLCAWLDDSKAVVRAFPLLWSLRNLDDLLQQWVNAEILNRSRAALEESKEVASVFVPTGAYSKAIDILNKYRFVVLEGPPEMGKTAIGRMIALTSVARGWEAIECRSPMDVERSFQEDVPQVFLADDFFGRTEYDPQLVSNWQRELPHILRFLNNDHWLILTTRAHLLNLAKQTLDLPGMAERFPDIGEVIVDASNLTVMEKSRILYRHLKRGNFPLALRSALKGLAEQTVKNPHFTPERIRRLALDGLPLLVREGGSDPKAEAIGSLIGESLVNPTKSMRISFRNLRVAEKWLLFALVEFESSYRTIFGEYEDGLEMAYERLCPLEGREPFNNVFTALSQAFVRRYNSGAIGWVHPSCRDLAIEELSDDPRFRTRFLENTDIGGLRLAMSIGGGRGERKFPLLRTENDWRILGGSLLKFNELEMSGVTAGSTALEVARRSLKSDDVALVRLSQIVCGSLWPSAVRKLNLTGRWTVELVEAFVRLGVGPYLQDLAPDLSLLWEDLKALSIKDASSSDTVMWDRYSNFDLFSRLAIAIRQAGLSGSTDSEKDIREVVRAWTEASLSEEGTGYDTRDWTPSDFENASRGYAACGGAIERLGKTLSDEDGIEDIDHACSVMETLSEELSRGVRDFYREKEDRFEADERDVSIAALFSDL